MTSNPSSPKVSICCITYNHESYIKECLDGMLMQQTDFPFEIIIHDDCSTDGTTEIVREYAQKNPGIIRPIFQEINQFQHGERKVLKMFVLPLVRGKYVALCEGDDYWTDPLKLQKQVAYMDTHEDCAICFHPNTIKWENKLHPDALFPTFSESKLFSIDDLLKENFLPTASVIYRWPYDRESNRIEDAYPSVNFLPGDWFLHLLIAEHGNIYFLANCMSVYRRHPGGIWWGGLEDPDFCVRCGPPFLRFYILAEDRFKADFSEEKRILLEQIIPKLIVRKETEQLAELAKMEPSLYQSAILKIVLSFSSNEKNLQLTIEQLGFQLQSDAAMFQNEIRRLRKKIRRYKRYVLILSIISFLFLASSFYCLIL